MKLIAFDCSSPWFHGAIRGGSHDCELAIRLDHGHQEAIVPLLDGLCTRAGLKPADLDGIIVGKGPGSFTGVRVAMAAAKGFAMAAGKPLVSVSLLDAVARQLSPLPCPGSWPLLVPLLDGKKQRFYTALFDGGMRVGGWLDIGSEALLALLQENSRGKTWGVMACGPDAELFREQCAGKDGGINWVQAPPQTSFAMTLLALGQEKLAEGTLYRFDEGPEYVRVSDADLGITLKKPR